MLFSSIKVSIPLVVTRAIGPLGVENILAGKLRVEVRFLAALVMGKKLLFDHGRTLKILEYCR